MNKRPVKVQDLRKFLESQFPPTATCWSQATDEVRDMSRWARETLLLDATHAVAFNKIKTPSEWNRIGIASIIDHYSMMGIDMKWEFINRLEDLFLLELQ